MRPQEREICERSMHLRISRYLIRITIASEIGLKKALSPRTCSSKYVVFPINLAALSVVLVCTVGQAAIYSAVMSGLSLRLRIAGYRVRLPASRFSSPKHADLAKTPTCHNPPSSFPKSFLAGHSGRNGSLPSCKIPFPRVSLKAKFSSYRPYSS